MFAAHIYTLTPQSVACMPRIHTGKKRSEKYADLQKVIKQ